MKVADRLNGAKVGGVLTKSGDDLIRLIAVDFDGTLLTSDGILAPEGVQLIGAAARTGLHVVLATVRYPASVRDYCRLLESKAFLLRTNIKVPAEHMLRPNLSP